MVLYNVCTSKIIAQDSSLNGLTLIGIASLSESMSRCILLALWKTSPFLFVFSDARVAEGALLQKGPCYRRGPATQVKTQKLLICFLKGREGKNILILVNFRPVRGL